ncbi:hypothetical protein [Paracraurococcus ruber]|uniref:Uncharacterized protein n=1 Tax=Paracraurococcus ruber TaxID=77675 RepID=A0ABS1CVL4_9PROT|nr:hypothetical protein [Paracraurococcus ruber]MBK1658542.1 hypothetical protein [Paracraurococcus ruber]TDG33177.1 hypothetical protein E2C05_04820 [Paracraurococcus ruber]
MTACLHREDASGGCPVRDLEPEALFCVAVLRRWVAARRPGAADAPDWREVCRQGELPDAAVQAFDTFLDAMHRGMRRPLDIRCCACPVLGRDEALLLAMLEALQRHDALGALDVLADWLAPPCVMPALPLAERLAAAAGDCDIRIAAPAPVGPDPDPDHRSAGRPTLH